MAATPGDVEGLWNQALSTYGGKPALLDTAEAWRIALEYLNPPAPRMPSPPQHVLDAFALLDKHRLHTAILDEMFTSIDRMFDAEIEPKLVALSNGATAAGANAAMKIVCDSLDTWSQPLVAFGRSASSARHAVRTRFQTLFYAKVPLKFGAGLRNVYRDLLKQHANGGEPSGEADDTIERLHLLALVDRYETLLLQAVYESIEERVETQCRGEWTDGEGQLRSLLKWVEVKINVFLVALVERSHLLHSPDRSAEAQATAKSEAGTTLRGVFQRFRFYVHQTLGDLRTSELFDIIVDFPDSKPALEDLRMCLQQTDRHSHVASQMIAQNARRLLHPGADTKDIISQYIAMIRALRILDPQGVLLARVAAPVRVYLRAREDTIRTIMSALIDDGGELAAELEKDPTVGTGSLLDASADGSARFGAPDDDYTDVNWVPDPVDAPPDYRKNRAADIIQLLVSIYDSTEIFVKELQVLLGQRLLAVRGYDFEREIRNIEILKKRFGEARLAVCEVMLKDLADSKRVDALIHSPDSELPPVHPLIVSRLFWPAFQSSVQKLRLPPHLAAARKSYHQAFVKHKPDKFLRWVPQLGTITLKIELEDRTVEIDATPLQAAIIECFSQHDVWQLTELVDTLGTEDIQLTRNALFFWANQGVLRDDGAAGWRLLERAEEGGASVTHVIEDDTAAIQSVEEQQSEQLHVFWSYIQGMVRRERPALLSLQLRNLGALEITRIHAMLGRFVPDYSGHTVEELNNFLVAMEREGSVEQLANRSWKLAS